MILSRPEDGKGYGWTPHDIEKRYDLPFGTKGTGQIVAVVDTADNPNAASDLATYRKTFGLGTAKFYKYNQDGEQSNYPPPSPAFGIDIDQNIEMVSAACPKCTIYLVESNSNSISDLSTAVDEAVTLGAHVVEMGLYCPAGYGNCFAESTFESPGVIYVTTGGDDLGYAQNGTPASFGSVVAVGGTVLFKHGKKYTEEVWDGTGGGCTSNGGSTGMTKPDWQTDPDCPFRTDNDVAAVAWNIAIYDSYGFNGWLATGGTQASASLIAGIFGLAGNAKKLTAAKKFWTLPQSERAKDLHYISKGANGACGGEYLCQAGTKEFGTYSGPAGWGTPNGIGAF